MAAESTMGKKIRFSLSENEFNEKIEAYKAGVEAGTIPHPCPSDWYVFIGYGIPEMRELMEFEGVRDSAYNTRAIAARKMLEWVKNQVVVNPYWTYNTARARQAVAILSKDWGDGDVFNASDTKNAGPAKVQISFGGSDPRAKKAAK